MQFAGFLRKEVILAFNLDFLKEQLGTHKKEELDGFWIYERAGEIEKRGS